MIDDYANRFTEWIIPTYPGSESIMLDLRVGSPVICVENDCADKQNIRIFSLCMAIVNWHLPVFCTGLSELAPRLPLLMHLTKATLAIESDISEGEYFCLHNPIPLPGHRALTVPEE